MKFLRILIIKYRDLKLRTKLIISYIILIAVPTIIIGYVYYNTSSSIILDSARQNIYEIVKKNNSIIDIKLSQIQETTNNFILDGQLFEVFNRPKPKEDYEIIQMDRKVREIMNKYFAQFLDIYSVHIVTSYFQFGDSDFTFLKKDIFSKTKLYYYALDSKGKLRWVPTYDVKNMFRMDDLKDMNLNFPYLFSGVKQLNITTVEPVGRIGNAQSVIEMKSLDKGVESPVLILSFKEDMFKRIYDNSVKVNDAYNYIITRDGEVISHPDASKIGKTAYPAWLKTAIKNKSGTILVDDNGKEMMVCYDALRTNDWISAIVVPVDSLLKSLPNVRYYSLYFGIVLTFIAILLAFIISGWIVKPLKNLLIGLKKIGEGDFNNSLTVPSQDEIGLLVHNFNNMNDKIQQLIEENYETKIRENEAHIMALNLQLNPHFLSNTLNIINWMAIDNNQTDISKMIISLSSMLEYTLRHNEEIALFKDDFQWLKNYMFIMSNRFYGIFEVIYEIDYLLENQKVPKLFMQPFVENSIIHGFETVQSGGLVKISGTVSENTVRFCIEDNGKGMSQETIYNVINSNGDRIGVRNIDKRIKLIFGLEYGVSIHSELGRGTKVVITMPFSK